MVAPFLLLVDKEKRYWRENDVYGILYLTNDVRGEVFCLNLFSLRHLSSNDWPLAELPGKRANAFATKNAIVSPYATFIN